ncbi:hypothetical protein [Streptomyces sp. NPDC091299]|uniref:hypothetical protein n=1 Tax=Streptomyces sp. NPDC091299 TaxID=3155302 RepID=UPI0034460D1D
MAYEVVCLDCRGKLSSVPAPEHSFTGALTIPEGDGIGVMSAEDDGHLLNGQTATPLRCHDCRLMHTLVVQQAPVSIALIKGVFRAVPRQATEEDK